MSLRSHVLFSSLSVCTVLAGNSLAGPTVVFVDATRSIFAQADEQGANDPAPTISQTDTDSATGFGPAQLSAAAELDVVPDVGGTAGVATQNSTFGTDRIDLSGSSRTFGAIDRWVM